MTASDSRTATMARTGTPEPGKALSGPLSGPLPGQDARSAASPLAGQGAQNSGQAKAPSASDGHPEQTPGAPVRYAIALAGHSGRMGTMLKRAWQAGGHTVSGIDCAPGDHIDEEAVRQAAIVVLAVPVSVLCEVMNRLAALIRPDQLLMDITSVKVLPMQIMHEFHNGPIIGTHPLFGPKPDQKDMHTVLVRGRRATPAWEQAAEALFTGIGSTVSWAEAAEHDHGVAFAQSLNFAMSTAFFSTIARHRECLPFLTPSFRRHMEAARKHLTLDRSMFCEFTSHNPCFAAALKAYQDTLQETLTNLWSLSAEAAVWFACEAPPEARAHGRPTPPKRGYARSFADPNEGPAEGTSGQNVSEAGEVDAEQGR